MTKVCRNETGFSTHRTSAIGWATSKGRVGTTSAEVNEAGGVAIGGCQYAVSVNDESTPQFYGRRTHSGIDQWSPSEVMP